MRLKENFSSYSNKEDLKFVCFKENINKGKEVATLLTHYTKI